MEEELNEHDLEDRLYSMLHHVDETQNNVNQSSNKDETSQLFENGPRSTIRRYWRTSAETNPHVKVNTSNPHVKINPLNPHVKAITNNPYVKINTPKPAPIPNNSVSKPNNDNTKPKEEKGSSPTPPGNAAVDLSIFESPIPQNVKTTIQIIECDDNQKVILESSDEDEVVEVALPPKPTITIESSDEDEVAVIKPNSASKTLVKPAVTSDNTDRAISASPVPSVVSSVSDDFIRGDCIALNISSRQPDNPSFDFSLHGSDLPIQDTPSKKKKKRKNKEAVTSTPIAADNSANQDEECFATPKSKAKNKKKTKPNSALQKSIPAPDFYDSDSNQSIIDITKGKNAYAVTEKSLPSADVYESDSSQSEAHVQLKEKNNIQKKTDLTISDTGTSKDNEPKTNKPANTQHNKTNDVIVDLTENDSYITLDDTDITESIVMANVTGFTESEDYGDENHMPLDANISKYVSSKVPSILNADLDFDNLKGKDQVCNKRRYSMTSLRAEMEKFYNESWGGEDFNHREIQKNMSRDKNLWIIDPKDRMPSYGQKKVRCNYCNRAGHRDDMCVRKPAVCYMCGVTGHNESRCPSKICVNCGAPNQVYTNICRNCSSWSNLTCSECDQAGHPASHCPDLWRRYHNTIDINMPLEKCFGAKKPAHQYCSGCSRRGHLIHTCRTTIPFANHPINSPYVCVYRPIYFPWQDNRKNNSFSELNQYSPNRQHNKSFSQDSTISSATTTPTHDRNKRQSKSPSHENHINKKRNLSTGDDGKNRPKTPTSISRPNPPIKEVEENTDNKSKSNVDTTKEVESAPDFIPLNSSNHNNRGQVIQDNEVSDTSDAVTSARMYITEYIYNKLQTKEHQDWLKETTQKLNVTVQCCGGAYPFLSIKGKVADQESFQYSLRERKWEQDPGEPQHKSKTEAANQDATPEHQSLDNLPKNRYNLIRHLNKALDTLKQNLGNPKEIHKELTFLQTRHDKLIKQKVINPTVLSHSRSNINNVLKKLNTVLLGQAGLANGTDSVNQLYTFKEKLSGLRGNTISKGLRNEIGEHFHCIFSPNARDDYSELLKLYEKSLPNFKTGNKKKKKKKPLASNPQSTKTDIIPPQQDGPQTQNAGTGDQSQKNIQIRKLKFYQQRLMNSKPTGAAQKKAKGELVRKMYSCIASINKNIKMTSKQIKKVRKAQHEAQSFLSVE